MPADGIVIRRAGLRDAGRLHAAVVSLSRYVDDEDQVLSSVEDFRRYGFGGQPAFFGEIAEIGGEFAGMCLHFPIFSTWMGRPGVYIQDLYVEKQFRGRKVGERLLRHVARLSRAAGGVYLRLSVDTDNVNAQSFYTSIGIARSEYEQVHKITGEAFASFCDDRSPA